MKKTSKQTNEISLKNNDKETDGDNINYTELQPLFQSNFFNWFIKFKFLRSLWWSQRF